MGNKNAQSIELQQSRSSYSSLVKSVDIHSLQQSRIKHRKDNPHNNKISKSQNKQVCVTLHRTQNPYELAEIFKMFMKENYCYIQKVQVVNESNRCFGHQFLRVESYLYPKISLDNLLAIKRAKHMRFAENQIWYMIQSISDIFSYLQANNLPYGSINAKRFFFKNGRFTKIQTLHFLPHYQHCHQISLINYYSPQFIKYLQNCESTTCSEANHNLSESIDIFRSEVFSFGLLILEILICPQAHPKFTKFNFKEILWSQIIKKMEVAQKYYSQKLISFMKLILREDYKIRPDWSYIRVWIKKEKKTGRLFPAPCIFWTI